MCTDTPKRIESGTPFQDNEKGLELDLEGTWPHVEKNDARFSAS